MTGGTQLIKYDAAVKALAECVRVDEAKDLQDKAAAAQAYARQANDPQLLSYATEIRMRAQRRVGEILIQMKEQGTRRASSNTGAKRDKNLRGRGAPRSSSKHDPGPVTTDAPPTISDLGIGKDQAKRWQKLAKLSSKEFEERIAVVTGAKPKPKRKAKTEPKNPQPSKPTTSKKKERLDEYSTAENPAEVERKMFLHTTEDAADLAETTLSDLKKNPMDFSDIVRKELDNAVATVIAAWSKVQEHLKKGE